MVVVVVWLLGAGRGGEDLCSLLDLGHLRDHSPQRQHEGEGTTTRGEKITGAILGDIWVFCCGACSAPSRAPSPVGGRRGGATRVDQSDPEGPAVEANEGGRLITTSRALYNVFKLVNQYAYYTDRFCDNMHFTILLKRVV